MKSILHKFSGWLIILPGQNGGQNIYPKNSSVTLKQQVIKKTNFKKTLSKTATKTKKPS